MGIFVLAGAFTHFIFFHIGRNEHGRQFEDEYTHCSADPKDANTTSHTSFDESVIAPFGRYLKSLFPPEVRAQRACNKADLQVLETMDDDDNFDNDDEPIPSPTTHEAVSALPTADPASTLSASVPASPLFGPTTELPAPPLLNPIIERASMPSPSVPAPPSFDATMFHDIDPRLFEHMDFGHAYFGMTPTDADCRDYDGLLGHHPSSSVEEVSFPFIHEHGADMEVDHFRGFNTMPFNEPPLTLLPTPNIVDSPQSP
ncbi:hypothetical protein IW261DRAFT_1566583 [Armillaria novae-zelandiae]|uniref:Uncharacterized protein n=1 Tax=Armillaria novae-zelandiae TaxID=153914 RepID=A0AA39P3Y3_9AGAR|nr:hypothetical protein IW261DRAFT_1566583 [Armillaria novae-zelandiae]